jgi:two-component system, OmpR family, sensor histidine kinase KdpD
MERVFCNLLENASKYSPEPSVITINAERNDHSAIIRIHNEGDGFPSDATKQLLNIFERGKQESSIPGFGIGLAICRSIIEVHGGHIRVFNPAEGGACVEFTLPLGTPPKLENEPAQWSSP